ncbi:hypothetical protein AYI70_g3563 [Smittium culicis]|uniref:Uncharacterized protein n=1 Tax=Smittium culicis TaxID=133412 RepID=A0A1R1Y3I3_9FUNG|nr:hypothetical protein AYI70_g3563 [Smittium culicis]
MNYFDSEGLKYPDFSEINFYIEKVKNVSEALKSNQQKLHCFSNLPPDYTMAQIQLAQLIQYHVFIQNF